MSSESSPFSSRLGSNYCPSDEEILQIQTLLIEPKHRLKKIDDEIAELQRAIDKLTQERSGVATYVISHEALLAPIRRLPVDVLREVFVACLPTNRNSAMSASETPILLGRICGSWRKISHSTPVIWARIHIVQPSIPLTSSFNPNTSYLIKQKADHRLNFTKTWLSRSGQRPLSISFEATGQMHLTPPGARSITEFLDTLLPFSHRWQHLELHVPQDALDVLAHLSPADVPLLRGFYFQDVFSPLPGPFSWDDFGILRSSNLSSLRLWGASLNSWSFPWDQLTTIDIGGDASWQFSDTFLAMITRCSKLCDWFFAVDGMPLAAENWVIKIPSLETSSIVLYYVQQPDLAILDRLSFPHLRHLSFSGSDLGMLTQDPDPQPLCRFFMGLTYLESLHLYKHPFPKSTLLQICQVLPSALQHLEIIEGVNEWPHTVDAGKFIDDTVLQELTPHPSRSHACPALKTLIIKYSHFISDDAVLEFIRARMDMEVHQSAPTLRCVQLDFQRPIEVDTRPSLQPYIDAGLEVFITHAPPPSFSPWGATLAKTDRY